MSVETTEYNLRQLRLMLSFIDEYKTEQSGLGSLVSNLEALRSTLESPDASFIESFEPLWSQLEVTYAMMLDEERTSPNEIEKKMIVEAMSGLKSLISNHL